jgi:hypothetical protein
MMDAQLQVLLTDEQKAALPFVGVEWLDFTHRGKARFDLVKGVTPHVRNQVWTAGRRVSLDIRFRLIGALHEAIGGDRDAY